MQDLFEMGILLGRAEGERAALEGDLAASRSAARGGASRLEGAASTARAAFLASGARLSPTRAPNPGGAARAATVLVEAVSAVAGALAVAGEAAASFGADAALPPTPLSSCVGATRRAWVPHRAPKQEQEAWPAAAGEEVAAPLSLASSSVLGEE